MLPNKWCQFLMRMMSPLSVGLIFVLLIPISSSHWSTEKTSSNTHHFTTSRPSYFTHASNYSSHQPSSSAHLIREESKLKKHVHLPFAKDSLHDRTKPSIHPSRYFRPSDSSGRNTEPKGRILPNMKLKTKFKVKNGTGVNSTIIYLPRLNRAMRNFSSPSVHTDLQPIIVSSRRRVLIEPKDFKLNKNQTSKTSNPPTLQKREAPTRFAAIERRNTRLKITESEDNKAPLYPNAQIHQRSSEKEVVKSRPPPELKLFVKIISENENGTHIKKKSTIVQVSPTAQPQNPRRRNKPFKHRRRGKQLELDADSSTNNKESIPEIANTKPTLRKPSNPEVSDMARQRTTLFDYAYYTGKQRDSKLANNPQASTTDFDVNTSIPPSTDIPQLDYGASYTEKKAKNLTIYEILKPKLKGSDPLNLNTFISSLASKTQNDENIQGNEENVNGSRLLNEIRNETPPFRNSMVILPSRIDSSYGIEYVIVNRNDSAVISPLQPKKPASNETREFGKRSNDSLVQKYSGQKQNQQPNEKISIHKQDYMNKTQMSLPKDLLRLKADGIITARSKDSSNMTLDASDDKVQYDSPDYVTLLYESDSIRKSKMAADSTPMKNLKLDSKMFYDYFAKKPIGNITIRDFPYPEFRPGNMFRYSDIYNRKPILDVVITRPPPLFNGGKRREGTVTQASVMAPTTFNSLRTSMRVLSTFYPNRMQDVTMKFENRVESTTLPVNEELPEFHQDDEFDEYRDAIDPGFTMEKLAYLLIGTCCGLSILCLFVVVIAIKCRRSIVEKRLKAQFKKRMYYHEKMKDIASPWQQQMFDHFMYLHRRPGGDSSCSRSTESCNCRCVTWSLGARNLDSTRPLCSTDRRSSYLCGQKKLPFGAASTLRYESMLGGRKRTTPDTNPKHKNDSPTTDSSHENDSLDIDSDSREGDGPKQCTCIDYNIWPMPPSNVPRGFYTMCPNVGRYNVGNCSQHPPVELRTISRDIPPPVTGSNYLDRSEGVVYWSSNDERLI